MAVLKNARHERFAQAIASGETQDAAYKSAGYKPSRSSASALRTKPNIDARVSTILANGAAQAEVTVATVTEAMLRIADKGENYGDPAGLSVARNAWMDAAKLAGIVVEKVQREDVTPATVPTRSDIEARRLAWDAKVAERTGARLN